MVDEKDAELDQVSIDEAEQAAAFAASFEGANAEQQPAKQAEVEKTEAEKAPAEKAEDKQEASPADAKEPVVDAAPQAPSHKADEPDVKAELRKLHGRIGSLNDQLQQALKAKEAEAKPAAVLSTVQLKRLKEDFPEIAEMLEGDIAEAIKGMAQKTSDPKEIQDLVAQQVADEVFFMRLDAITDRHPTWATDCWSDQPGGTRTPEYQAWLNTMTEADADAFENSQNPSFVNRKLDQFYDWKSKAAKTETEKQQRLKAAVAPKGTSRANQLTTSEEEAERKAFEDSFNQ